MKAKCPALVQFDKFPEVPVKNTIAQVTADYKSKTEYFVHKLAESIAKVAAAFHPQPGDTKDE